MPTSRCPRIILICYEKTIFSWLFFRHSRITAKIAEFCNNTLFRMLSTSQSCRRYSGVVIRDWYPLFLPQPLYWSPVAWQHSQRSDESSSSRRKLSGGERAPGHGTVHGPQNVRRPKAAHHQWQSLIKPQVRWLSGGSA